jgi:hypothetical protein
LPNPSLGAGDDDDDDDAAERISLDFAFSGENRPENGLKNRIHAI